MHLEGYGCAGTTAVAYGLACLELEAGDSACAAGVGAGLAGDVRDLGFGTEEQKQEWLPRMAAGEAIGCFGLTEPDLGSNPAGMRTRASRDGDDWVLERHQDVDHQRPVADVAVVWARTDDGHPRLRGARPTPRASPRREIRHKLSLRASVTSELVLDDVRLPADALLPEATGLRGPLSCLTEARFGIVFGALGAARDCLETAIDVRRRPASSSAGRSPGSS